MEQPPGAASPSPSQPQHQVLVDTEVHGTEGRRVKVIVSEFHGKAPPSTARSQGDESAAQPVGMSALSSVFTLCNSAIGAGVLSLPFAFKHSGLVGGVVLCVLVGAAEAFTLYVLSKFAERYQADSYGSLVRKTLGRKLMALLATIMVVYLLGSCIVYLIIIGDTFSALGALYFGPSSPSRNAIIMVLGLAVLLPLCLVRKLGHLASLSAAAVVGFWYTAGVVAVVGSMQAYSRWPNPMEGVALIKWDLAALYAVPIVCFGFNCHANVVSIFSELTDEAEQSLITSLPSSPRDYRALPALAPRPATYKLINMLSVIITGIMVILVGYVIVGCAGYVGYPDTVGGNVLNALPADNIFVQVAQAFIGLVVMGHFPLTHHPARTGMQDILTLMGHHTPPMIVSDIFTMLFVGGSVGVSLVVTSLGDALHIIGGTAASFMIFFLPGLMLINAAVVKESSAQLDASMRDPSKREGLNEALLRQAVAQGIKKTGIVYSPGKQWVAGVFLVVMSVVVLAITLATLHSG